MLVHNKGNYTRHAAGVMLIPGTNDVNAEDFKAFALHPICKALIKSREIVVVGQEFDVDTLDKQSNDDNNLDKEVFLKDLKAEEAIALVEDTFSVEYLENMSEGEDRKTVLAAIEAQIKSIVEGDGE